MKTYPEPVVFIAEQIYEVFEESLVEECQKDAEYCEPIAMEKISEFMLPKFLKGEELMITEKEVDILLRICLAEISMTALKEKGLIDFMEDENGEEVIFLTEKGKNYFS